MSVDAGLRGVSLAGLFPFLVVIDASMRVVEAGPAWARLCPEVEPGADSRELFALERPSGPWTHGSLAGRESTIFLVRTLPKDLLLRGQVTSDADGNLLLLASPWVTDASELTRLGLTTADFPPHVATPDFLFLLRAKNVALEDARRLTEEIDRQRAVIRSREDRLRRIIDASLDAVVSMDDHGRVTTWNRQAERTFGWTEGEALGRLMSDLIIPPSLREAHAKGLAHFLATGEGPVLGRRIEVPAMDRDGVELPVELAISAVHEGGSVSFHAFLRDIRERRAAEAELQESRARLDLAVEGADVGVWDWDLASDRIVGNDRWRELLGYGAEEMEGSGAAWRRNLHPDDVERAVAEVRAHLAGETPVYESEYRLRTRRGDWRWILAHGRVAARGDDGRPTRVSGVQIDVTKRKRSEQAIAVQNAVTQALADSLTLDAAAPRVVQALCDHLDWDVGEIWTLDPESSTLACSTVHPRRPDLEGFSSFEAITRQARCATGEGFVGTVAEERLPRWIRELKADRHFARKDAAAEAGLRSAVALPIRAGDELSGVLALYSREDRVEDFERIALLMTLASQVGQFVERRRSEAAREESEARLRHILDTALDAVISIDAAGRITAWSARAIEMFGYASEEVMGLPLDDVIIPASLHGVHARGLARYLATGETRMIGRRAEWTARDREGREFPVEVAVTRQPSAGAPSFAGFVRDITDRKRAEVEIAAARESAEAANEAKSRFLATMSHEIRTPLNPILGLTSLLLDADPSPEQRRYLERIRQSGMLLLRVINEILDFSKIEAGKVELEHVRFDARGLADWTRDLFAAQAREKGIDLAVQVSDAVPRLVLGDPGRVQQVLANLVSNAIKFTEKGGVLVTLEAGDAASGRVLLEYRVHDTGIGIPEERRESLFKPFTQADASTTRRFGGSGLGLAIARELARRMGGDIEVESDRAGSTFRFVVPVDACDDADDPAATVEAPQAAPARSRILVAEDNPANQEVIVLLLRRLGHAVDVAGDGDEAVAAFRRGGYDLVLMDCQMPGKDGFEATAAIRRLESPGRRTPIVAMTAFAVAGDRERCLEAGMDDYLSKPVEFGELRAMLARHLRPAGATASTAPAILRLPGRDRAVSATTSIDADRSQPRPPMREETRSVAATPAASAQAPASTQSAAPAVDEAVLARLRELELPGQPLVAKLVAMFLERTPVAVDEIARALAAGDDAKAARVAHDLKSESGNLGARALSALCSSMQDAARHGHAARASEILDPLRDEARRACHYFERLLPAAGEGATTSNGEDR